MITTLTPNPSFDRTVHLPMFEIGEVNRAERVTLEAGGKGINISRALASAGIETRCVFPANAADEATFRLLLEPVGDIEIAVVTNRHPIRVNSTILEPNGRTTKLNEPGEGLAVAVRDALLSAAIDAATSSRWLVCAGSLPQGVDDDFYREVVDRAGGLGAMIAIDTSGDALRRSAESGADLLKPNLEELESISGRVLPTLGDAIDAARELVEGGIGTVLVSLGSAGALLVSAEQTLHATAPPVTVRNTVGAGDAFLSGFVSDDRGGRDALVTAMAWGRAAVESDTTAFNIPQAGGAADIEVGEPDRNRSLVGT